MKKIMFFAIIGFFLLVVGCSSQQTSVQPQKIEDPEMLELVDKVAGTWDGSLPDSEDSIVSYIFNDDGTYSYLETNKKDKDIRNQLKQGNYVISENEIVLTVVTIDGMNQEEYVEKYKEEPTVAKDEGTQFDSKTYSYTVSTNTLTLTADGVTIELSKAS